MQETLTMKIDKDFIIEVTTVYNDGYIMAKVKEYNNQNNYLEYMNSPLNGWESVFGRIDDKDFKKDNLRISWRRSGRGKAKEETWKKLYIMQEYFINNSPDAIAIRKEYIKK